MQGTRIVSMACFWEFIDLVEDKRFLDTWLYKHTLSINFKVWPPHEFVKTFFGTEETAVNPHKFERKTRPHFLQRRTNSRVDFRLCTFCIVLSVRLNVKRRPQAFFFAKYIAMVAEKDKVTLVVKSDYSSTGKLWRLHKNTQLHRNPALRSKTLDPAAVISQGRSHHRKEAREDAGDPSAKNSVKVV